MRPLAPEVGPNDASGAEALLIGQANGETPARALFFFRAGGRRVWRVNTVRGGMAATEIPRWPATLAVVIHELRLRAARTPPLSAALKQAYDAL